MKQFKIVFTTPFLTHGINITTIIISAKNQMEAHRAFLRRYKNAYIKSIESIS